MALSLLKAFQSVFDTPEGRDVFLLLRRKGHSLQPRLRCAFPGTIKAGQPSPMVGGGITAKTILNGNEMMWNTQSVIPPRIPHIARDI